MRKLRVFLLTGLTFICFSQIAYAEWQIDISQWARKANYNYGAMLRGHFATEKECNRARIKMAQEAGDWMLSKYSKCVGYDEQNYSQPRQGSGSGTQNRFSITGPTNRTPEEEEMVRKARRTRDPRAALAAMKKERQQRQLNEQKKQQSQAEFEQGTKKIMTQLKGGSSGGGLNLKGGGRALALKSGNSPPIQHGKAIEDLRNSVYWALEAASAVSNENTGNYEKARQYGENSARAYAGGDIPLPSVPDVPAPVAAHPQVRLYKYLIRDTNRTTSELKLINANLKQAKENKKKSEKIIDLQKTMIKELKQKNPVLKKKNGQKGVDALKDAALAVLDEAKKQYGEASKMIVSLNEQKKKQEGSLSNLRKVFDTAQKHPEQAENILKRVQGSR